MVKKSMLGVVSTSILPLVVLLHPTETDKVRCTRPVDVILILADQKATPFEVWNIGSTFSVTLRPWLLDDSKFSRLIDYEKVLIYLEVNYNTLKSTVLSLILKL